MKIAYTRTSGRGQTDAILREVAERLIAAGHRPAGTVQINTDRPCSGPCDMDVRVLPDGPDIRISQDLGTQSRGCRLDPGALATAAGLVEASLVRGPDCLIVNKFGTHEAQGHGFRAAIADALAQGIPVLVGVNDLNLGAFQEFAGEVAQMQEPSVPALCAWLEAQIGRECPAA